LAGAGDLAAAARQARARTTGAPLPGELMAVLAAGWQQIALWEIGKRG
jgi:hypothetical protein